MGRFGLHITASRRVQRAKQKQVARRHTGRLLPGPVGRAREGGVRAALVGGSGARLAELSKVGAEKGVPCTLQPKEAGCRCGAVPCFVRMVLQSKAPVGTLYVLVSRVVRDVQDVERV